MPLLAFLALPRLPGSARLLVGEADKLHKKIVSTVGALRGFILVRCRRGCWCWCWCWPRWCWCWLSTWRRCRRSWCRLSIDWVLAANCIEVHKDFGQRVGEDIDTCIPSFCNDLNLCVIPLIVSHVSPFSLWRASHPAESSLSALSELAWASSYESIDR